MKNQLLLAIIFITIGLQNLSQTKTSFTTSKLGTVDITLHQEKWNTNIQNMEMPEVNGSIEKTLLQRIKETQALKYPRKNNLNQKDFNNTLGSNIFTSIEGFEGNAYNNRVPNDNSMAISNDGILMSCINSTYLIYDTKTNSLIDNGYLNDFIASYNITVSKYDPKITYDPNEDRFILSFLVGTIYQNSKIAMCFSTTNNPLDPWNVYLLDGNALGTNHWTDYPAISVNQDEVFLTGNLLENYTSWQTGFYQSIIWQIDKWDGYAGNPTLDFQIWSDLLDDTVKIRNIHPVKGARSLTGATQYFLSNKNFSEESDTIYLISLNNTLVSGSAQIEVKRLSTTDHYFVAPNAKQSIADELATNDSRVLGAITDGNWIQYVHNTLDTLNGTCAVYHGIISDITSASPTVSGVTISDPIMDLGYPNIASIADAYENKECVIGFNYTSPIDTNGMACVYHDNNYQYSDIIDLHRGTAPINILSGSVERWGDYFGIQRKFNEPCSIWMAGMYGVPNKNGCWISNVRTSTACEQDFASAGSQESSDNLNLYPNPTHDWTSLIINWETTEQVTISIMNLNGQLIDIIYSDKLKSGKNQVSFFTDHLENGVYLISVQSSHNTVTQKFIVE